MSVNRVHLPHRDWRLAGRPVHPVALGMAILMATLAVYNFIDRGELGTTILGDVVLALSASSLVALVAGWVTQQRVAVQVGLLAAAVTYCLRMTFLALESGLQTEGIYLSLGAMTIAGGSFLLEVWSDE